LLATTPWSAAGEKWLRAGIAFAGVLSLVIYAQAITPILPIAPLRDPIGRAFGWRDLTHRAVSVGAAESRITRTATWFGGDRYQEAAELAFHDAAHPITFATNLSGRANQYDLWPGFAARAHVGDNLLLMLDETREPHAAVVALSPFFTRAERRDSVGLR